MTASLHVHLGSTAARPFRMFARRTIVVRAAFLALLAGVGTVASPAATRSAGVSLAWWSESCGAASIGGAGGLGLLATLGQHDAVSVASGRHRLEGGYWAWGAGPVGSFSCRGDLNVDGMIDGLDLGAMLSAWGACSPLDPADLTSDGWIDSNDLGVLLGAWGDCARR